MTYSSGLNEKKVDHFGTKYSQESYPVNNGQKTDSSISTSCVKIFTKTVFMVAMLQVQTRCCIGCEDDEVTWRSNDATQNDTCLACIDCPDGMEPSIPCGTAAKYGTHLDCVACNEGTYSDNYGKEQCKPCSLCSVGRQVIRNCSTTRNSKCGSCKRGYYEQEVIVDLVYHCLPCSVCCLDGKDQLEEQCKAQGLPKHQHCKVRTVDGCQPVWTTTKPSSNAASLPANHGTKKETTIVVSTITTIKDSPIKHKLFGSTTSMYPSTAFTSLVTSAASQLGANTVSNRGHGMTNLPIKKSKGFDSNSSVDIKKRIVLITILTVVILIVIVIILKRNKLVQLFKWLRCRPIWRSRDSELGGHTESTLLDDIKPSSNVVPLGVLIFMKDLKSLSPDTYDKVWKRLDKQPEGTKKGDFKDVAAEFMFVEEDIWELEKELKSSGSGSPSIELLQGLETRRPRLTVLEFIKVLQKPNIHRDDIVKTLQDYTYR